jgi:hypothetical protein
MKVRFDLARLRQSKWQDYAVRFLFGGLVTALTGAIAAKFGPSVGGLFLAFPAILPASATLIEKHDNKDAAGFDTLGAAVGSIGLLTFAIVVWLFATYLTAWAVLTLATLVWFLISSAIWLLLQKANRSKSRKLSNNN